MAAPSDYRALVQSAGAGYRDYVISNDQPWSLVITWAGIDYTAATIAADVRTLPDLQLSGTALTVGTPTLVGADTVVTISLSEAQVEALGVPAEPGREIVLYYRVHVTPSGGAKRLRLAGKLTRLGS